MAALAADPANAYVPAAGGTSTHQLVNSGASRLVYRLFVPVDDTRIELEYERSKDGYAISPMFGFIEPGASALLDITRPVNPPKEDKLVVQFAEVAADATDPYNVFYGLVKEQKILKFLSLQLDALYVDDGFYVSAVYPQDLIIQSRSSEALGIRLVEHECFWIETTRRKNIDNKFSFSTKIKYVGNIDATYEIVAWYGRQMEQLCLFEKKVFSLKAIIGQF